MKITWISFFVTAVICQVEVIAWAVPQYQTFNPVPNSIVIQGGDSGVVTSLGYPVVENSISNYPTITTPVYSSSQSQPAQIYSSQGFPSQGYTSQGFSTVQLPQQSSYSPVVRTASYSGNYYASTNTQPGLAQQKATQAAQMSFRDHVGGSLGGAKYEGVGWSNQSPQLAVQNCCYWGQRAPAQIGVSKSQGGCWYACVLYH